MNLKTNNLILVIGLIVVSITLFYFKITYNNLPNPTGKYSVGTIQYHLVDENRKEVHSENPNDFRELMIQIWYPTSENKNKTYYIKKEALEVIKNDLSKACQVWVCQAFCVNDYW